MRTIKNGLDCTERRVKELSVEHCDEKGLSYLGMQMKKIGQDDIVISMDGHINKILKEYQEMSRIH